MRDGKLRVLDMKHADVREAVRMAHDAESVYLSSVAVDY